MNGMPPLKRKRRLRKGEPYVVYLPTHAGFNDGKWNLEHKDVESCLKDIKKRTRDARKWGDYEIAQYKLAWKLGWIQHIYDDMAEQCLAYATDAELDNIADKLTELYVDLFYKVYDAKEEEVNEQ